MLLLRSRFSPEKLSQQGIAGLFIEYSTMSVDRKSVHVRLSPELHQHLAVMAEFNDKDIAELAALFLEKMIVGEFHGFKLTAERMSRLGLTGSSRD